LFLCYWFINVLALFGLGMDEPNIKELKFGRPFYDKESLMTPSILRNIVT